MNSTKTLSKTIPQILALLCLIALVSGCSIYKINVQQGNYLDQEKIDQVQQGMTRNQVKYLLGTPMIADSFHNDRWDYVYHTKFGRTGRLIQRKVTIYFDGDAVTDVEQYGQNVSDEESASG